MKNVINNQKGLVMLAIPLTIAIIGLVGTGVFAGINFDKDSVLERDMERKENVMAIQDKLNEYHNNNEEYPVQKNETDDGYETLKLALGGVPQDPLAEKSWSYYYWSDGDVYTINYFLEETREEMVVDSQ